MTENYIISDGLNFYEELNSLINTENNTENNNEHNNENNNNIEEETDDVCLITNEKLEKHHVKLKCGHRFNYIALLNDVKNQKQRWFNKHYLQGSGYDIKLGIGQIKCPFCRNIQNNLLPYIPELYDTKLNGVNYPLRYCMFKYKCNYVSKSGKNKGKECGKNCNSEMCNKHKKIVEKQKEKQKEKQDNKDEKQLCTAILKSGPNKGKMCGCIVKSGLFCGKHNK